MRKELHDRMYLGVVISLLISSFSFFLFDSFSDEYDKKHGKETQETRKRLIDGQEDKKSHLKTIEDEIVQMQALQFSKDEQPYAMRLSEAVFLGDSMTESLYSYGLLYDSQCLGERGAKTIDFEQQYTQIRGKNIRYFFLQFGLNDTKYWPDDSSFISCYTQKIQMIKADYPEAKIFVNLILPVSEQTKQAEPAYARIESMNVLLRDMCKSEGIECLDATSLLSQENTYEFDGIHPTYSFYERWMDYMVRSAGL